jgi:hypothetical protein
MLLVDEFPNSLKVVMPAGGPALLRLPLVCNTAVNWVGGQMAGDALLRWRTWWQEQDESATKQHGDSWDCSQDVPKDISMSTCSAHSGMLRDGQENGNVSHLLMA